MNALPYSQHGAATVIAAMLLVTVVLTIGLSTVRMASTDITDSSLQRHSIEALFLAETGLENAAQQIANGASCDATLVMGSPRSYGNGDYEITSATLVGSLCQVEVTGRRLYGTAAQASRTIQGDIQLAGGNLLEPDANFDAYSCFIFWCWLDDWSTNPPFYPGSWDLEGPDGSAALWVDKSSPGGAQITTASFSNMNSFTVTAPTTLTVAYDYRVISTGQRARLTVQLSSGGTNYSNSIDYGPTTGFESGSLDISITGTGPVTIDDLTLTLRASPGLGKTLIVDNITIPGSGGGSIQIVGWREIIA